MAGSSPAWGTLSISFCQSPPPAWLTLLAPSETRTHWISFCPSARQRSWWWRRNHLRKHHLECQPLFSSTFPITLDFQTLIPKGSGVGDMTALFSKVGRASGGSFRLGPSLTVFIGCSLWNIQLHPHRQYTVDVVCRRLGYSEYGDPTKVRKRDKATLPTFWFFLLGGAAAGGAHKMWIGTWTGANKYSSFKGNDKHWQLSFAVGAGQVSWVSCQPSRRKCGTRHIPSQVMKAKSCT